MLFHGNIKFYSTFVDETLNMTLRQIAQHAHRRVFENRVFYFMSLIGFLSSGGYLFGSVDDAQLRALVDEGEEEDPQ